MNYSTVKELLNSSIDRETIRCVADYHSTDCAEWILSAICTAGYRQDCIDYMEELFDELYLHEVPEAVRNYIDYDSWVQDLQLGGDYSILEHKGHCVLMCNH